jgi:NDP-sugar pyrophosphorylase family protein
MDAGTPDRYLQLQRDLLLHRAGGALAIVERSGWPGLTLQRGADTRADDGRPPRLAAGAKLEGPVVLGDGVEIGANATISGPATVGARSLLASDSALIDSLLWEDCVVEEHASVNGSVLAGGCRIGAGARVLRSVLGDGVTVRPGAVVEERSIEPEVVV